MITSPTKGNTSNVKIEKQFNNALGGIAKDEIAEGITKVNGVTPQNAKVTLDITDLEGTGNQMIKLTLDGKVHNIKLDVDNTIITKKKIAEKIDAALGVNGKATIDANGKLIIESNGKLKNQSQSTIEVELTQTNNATGGLNITSPVQNTGLNGTRAEIKIDDF